jgi:SAM-dependent methyltransferase
VQEPNWVPIYTDILKRIGVGPGIRFLDVGCGAGGALKVARELGAEISGLDASDALIAVARERLPEARVEIGEMEELPFQDEEFDLVTGFNSFQFAADIVRALSEARRVCSAGGRVTALVWGRREDCELVSCVMPAIMALLPPAPPPAATPFDFGVSGVMEDLMQRAELAPEESGELDHAFEYPDAATAIRAISSAGPSTRAMRHSGEKALRDALAAVLSGFTGADGSVRIKNRFRWVAAAPARFQ